MILLPAHVKVLCLSATVSNCLDLAGWICQTRHVVCHLLLTQVRPTPLRTYGVAGCTRLLVDSDQVFFKENMEALLLGERGQLEQLIQDVAMNAKLTPTLAFMFSKVACQTHALALSTRLNQANAVADLISDFLQTDETSKKMIKSIKFWSVRKIQRLCPMSMLLTNESQQRIMQVVQETLQHLPEEDRALAQVTMLTEDLLPYGVACHHSDLLAPLRELVETLCADGLLPMLFCTETCAVGLNLPAKSVAFSFTENGLVKCDGCIRRPVRTGEYCQMAGRAGRRGFDKHGSVLLCIGEEKKEQEKDKKKEKSKEGQHEKAAQKLCEQFKQVALNPVEPLTSSFVLRFSSVLNLLQFGHAGYVRWFMLQTFQQFQSRKAAASVQQEKTQMSMFAVLEEFGFVSPEQRLTNLGRAAASFWVGDPLLLAMLLQEKAFEGFPALEVMSFLSIFVVEPNFRKKQSDEEEPEDSQVLISTGDLLDSDGEEFQKNIESLARKFLDCARLLSDAYATAGLLIGKTSKNEDYLKNWRGRGCLSFKQFTRFMKDGKNMLLGIRIWLLGRTFSEVLKVARVDAGTLAKSIRRLAKLVKEMIKAAVKLDQVDFAEQLQGQLSCLQRGLPFLPSLLLSKWEALPAESGAEVELSWPSCPDAIGQIVNIKPSQVGFSHNACSAHFKDGRSVLFTLTQILAGQVSPAEIEELRIYWHQGMYYTLGNRRLCVYRLLEQSRPNTVIRARVVSEAEADAWDWKNKFTSGRWKGAVVLLRHTGEIIGKNPQQSTFLMPSAEDVERMARRPSDEVPAPLEEEFGTIGYWQELSLG